MIPQPPQIKIEIVSQKIVPEKGYIRICQSVVRFVYPDGSKSEPTLADHNVLNRIDAVAVFAHYMLDGVRMVYLRSCIRHGMAMTDFAATGNLNFNVSGNLWEVASGMVELDELGYEGLQGAASRECKEELGFDILPKNMKPLGPPIYVCSGVLPERIFLFETIVDPNVKGKPLEDGSPYEAFGEVISAPLEEALTWITSGVAGSGDAKTEIGLNRLVKSYGI